MRTDALDSNDPFSKIDDLVVEHMSRILGPTLLRRFEGGPKQNIALRSSLNRNRYLKQGAEYGTSFCRLPPVTNCSLRQHFIKDGTLYDPPFGVLTTSP